MTYSTLNDVQFWGQFATTDFGSDASDYDYINSVQRLIDFTDGEIDNYCRVPKGFFAAGGIVQDKEYHNGKDVPSGNKPLFRPSYLPIIIHDQLKNVTLEYLQNGTWTTKTEGASSDYLVLEDGLILITLPDRTTYKNIRVTYRCGYVQTPDNVVTVSGRLAAAIGQLIIDAKKRKPVSIQGISTAPTELASLAKVAFTPKLKELLVDFRLRQVQVYRG